MKVSKEKKQEILDKNEKLNKLSKYLKEEFIGIDNIIDNIINSMRPFYLFPESLNKPIVINLWGMTGTGKTSLVEKIVTFLDLEKSYIKYDMGQSNSNTSKWDFIENFNKNLGDNITSNYIIVLDEFQLGRTLDDNKSEKDNTCRYIWDLVDSGKLNYGRNKYLKEADNIIKKLKLCAEKGVEVDKNGFITKGFETYLKINRICKIEVENFEYGYNDRYNNVYFDKENSIQENLEKYGKCYFVLMEYFEKIAQANPDFFNYDKSSENRNNFFGKSLTEIIETLEEVYNTAKQIFISDYSKSIIFCLGNLDEIYYMAKNINPDIDADTFHEDSLKINLTHVKQALGKRFRVEQISRLGNNHFIYPAFSRKSYELFIAKYLDKVKNNTLNNFNLDITFSKEVNEMIYKEGVFPAQGIRPLLSTLNNYIDNNLSLIITDLMVKHNKITKIEWGYNTEDKMFLIKNKKNVLKYKVETKLEDLRKIDNKQTQALVAVHEAGHALVSSIVLSIAPDEVLSKTASEAEGYCLFKYGDNPMTKDFLLKRIMVLLGGSEAEKLIFGENHITIGSQSDITKATDIAFNIVKRYGMNHPFNISTNMDESLFSKFIKDEKYEEEIISIILDMQEKTKEVLEKNKKYLLLLSKVLFEKPKILKEEVKEILKDLNIKWNDEGIFFDFEKELNKQLNTQNIFNEIDKIIVN